MGYKNGKDIFPHELLEEIQKYVGGDYVYIPQKDSKAKWGEKSGVKEELIQRNKQIRIMFKAGTSIEELSFLYGLSIYTVRKIVYSKKRGE